MEQRWIYDLWLKINNAKYEESGSTVYVDEIVVSVLRVGIYVVPDWTCEIDYYSGAAQFSPVPGADFASRQYVKDDASLSYTRTTTTSG